MMFEKIHLYNRGRYILYMDIAFQVLYLPLNHTDYGKAFAIANSEFILVFVTIHAINIKEIKRQKWLSFKHFC